MSTDTASPHWRRLSDLGTPKRHVDYVLMSPVWQHSIVCRWDGRRWFIRTPNSLRDLDLAAASAACRCRPGSSSCPPCSIRSRPRSTRPEQASAGCSGPSASHWQPTDGCRRHGPLPPHAPLGQSLHASSRGPRAHRMERVRLEPCRRGVAVVACTNLGGPRLRLLARLERHPAAAAAAAAGNQGPDPPQVATPPARGASSPPRRPARARRAHPTPRILPGRVATHARHPPQRES